MIGQGVFALRFQLVSIVSFMSLCQLLVGVWDEFQSDQKLKIKCAYVQRTSCWFLWFLLLVKQNARDEGQNVPSWLPADIEANTHSRLYQSSWHLQKPFTQQRNSEKQFYVNKKFWWYPDWNLILALDELLTTFSYRMRTVNLTPHKLNLKGVRKGFDGWC